MAAHDTFHHVRDFPYFELPQGIHVGLPEVFGFQVTKFMVLQVVAGLLTLFIFSGLARRVQSGKAVKGRFWNFWEAIALYLRDEVVRPTIGEDHHHDHVGDAGDGHSAADGADSPASRAVPMGGHSADKYLPFVWTCFFYVLFCNLLGAIPFLGSATGEINVTGALAIAAFCATVFYGLKSLGPGKFTKNFLGGIEINGPSDWIIGGILFAIELLGFFVKHGVLAVRLFANIMGGHTVLGVMLAFIAAPGLGNLFYLVAPASVFGQAAVGLLELLVAFIQAYVFAFLVTIFIGMAVHEH